MKSLSEKWKGAILMLASIMSIVSALATIYSCSRNTGPELAARCTISELPDQKRTFPPTLADCTITNSGVHEATDVRLYLPSKILGFKSYNDGAEVCFTKDYLEVKSLRPETSVRVMAWSEHYFSWDKKFRLNSREAAGTVEIGKVMFGPISRFIDWLEEYGAAVSISIAFMLMGIVLLSDRKQSRNRDDET